MGASASPTGRSRTRWSGAPPSCASIGIQRGDVVTIQLPNRIVFPIAFFALELIGAIANKVNPDFRVRELDYILRFSGSRAFICPACFKGFDYVAMARQLRDAIPELTHVVVAGGTVDGGWDLERGIAESPPLAPEHRVRMGADEIFRMAFTSGTTGNPKCVLHSINTTLPAVHQINADMAVTERDVQLVYLPVCLNWGYLCLLQAIVSGGRAVLLERFSAKDTLNLIQRERVTYIATAPASIVAMLNEPGLADYDVSSLRVVITGGASAAIETIRDYQARIPGHLIELYGMLETGFHTYTRFSDDPAKVNGTIGRVVSSMELKILDEPGQEVARGEVARSRRWARVFISATMPMQRPMPRHSRPMAGSARAISAASSTRRATSRSSGGARRSSTAAERSFSRERSRRSSTRIPRSCMRPWSASLIGVSASAIVSASFQRPDSP